MSLVGSCPVAGPSHLGSGEAVALRAEVYP